MRHLISMKLAVLVGLFLAISSVCIGQMPQPFSADMSASTANGTKMTGKYNFSPPNSRIDMSTNGHNVTMITNSSTQVTYMVDHTQHMYMEMHGNQATPFTHQTPGLPNNFDPNNPCVWEAQQGNTCRKLGTETVNGRVCDKYQGTSKDGKTTGTGWIDQRLHFPIKFLDSKGSQWDLTNIKEGRQDASLFQPPDGYRKMVMPGTMGGRPPR